MVILQLIAEWVRAEEEVADGLAHPVGEPALALMLVPVVKDVAPLAERLEVRGRIIAWVVIQMGAGQIHPGRIARRVGR